MKHQEKSNNLIKCDKGWEHLKSNWPHKEEYNEPKLNRIEIESEAGTSTGDTDQKAFVNWWSSLRKVFSGGN